MKPNVNLASTRGQAVQGHTPGMKTIHGYNDTEKVLTRQQWGALTDEQRAGFVAEGYRFDALQKAPETDRLHKALVTLSEQDNWIAGKDYVDMRKHAGELESERDRLSADNKLLREALEQIANMRTMPDNKVNTLTLVAAHELARAALKAGKGKA